MFKSNLPVLMAKNSPPLKIIDVEADTGISRTTLTKIYYNRSEGVSFNTLDVLCEYFNCTPAEVFIYTANDEDGKEK